MQKKVKSSIMDWILLVLSLFFLIGSRTIFAPCGPKEDGSFMTCHWAGNAIFGSAAVLVVLFSIHLLVSDAKIKIGLSIAAILTAAYAAMIPGSLIPLCMMDTMRCRAIMRPMTVIMAGLIIIVCIVEIIVLGISHNKKNQ